MMMIIIIIIINVIIIIIIIIVVVVSMIYILPFPRVQWRFKLYNNNKSKGLQPA